MPHLTGEELRELSREEPPWKPGDPLRLDHPRSSGRFITTVGSLYTLRRLYFEDNYWMAVLEGSPAAFYSGRFSLAPTTKPRYKTNHKIGVPKGKLP